MVPTTSTLLYLYLPALLLAVWFLTSTVRSYLRLAHVPGPRLNAWTIWPLFNVHLQGAIYDTFGALNKTYGPLVRIAPNTLLTSDPEVLRRKSAARSPYTRSDWFIAMRLNPGQDNVLSQRDEAKHDELRRKMASGYSGKENLELERDIDACVAELVDLVQRKYLSGANGESETGGAEAVRIKPMDLAQKIQFFTSDIMSKLSFDAKFHDLRDDNDNLGYIHEIETLFPNIFCTCTIPEVVEFLTNVGILGLMSPSAESGKGTNKLGLGKVLAITREQVAKRFGDDGNAKDGSEGGKSDMLASFIRHGLSQREAESESVMQL